MPTTTPKMHDMTTKFALMLAKCMLIVDSGEIPGPECKPALEYKVQELLVQAVDDMNVCVKALSYGVVPADKKHCLKGRIK